MNTGGSVVVLPPAPTPLRNRRIKVENNIVKTAFGGAVQVIPAPVPARASHKLVRAVYDGQLSEPLYTLGFGL